MKKLNCLVLFFFSLSCHADSPAMPVVQVTAGVFQSPYYFVMIPAKRGEVDGEYTLVEPALGKAFKVNNRRKRPVKDT